MRPFVLESSGLRLEVPGTADIPAIVEACSDPDVVRFTTVPTPYHRGDAEFFLSQIVDFGWSTGREYTWGVREPGSSLLLGMVSLRLRAHDIGFWLAPQARGRGLMSRAVTLVADWAFTEGGLPDVLWEGYVGNDGSAAVARRAGFTYTGVGPGLHPGRDGGRPSCWKARLLSTDDRTPRAGWPASSESPEYDAAGGVDLHGTSTNDAHPDRLERSDHPEEP
ncbi:GNAT family N-acetyltransferase [Frigoribacterium sp. 2-23]|uniref:GNAT family N-acetyltransferase n=1 Tax=Frigoribacterium sp. 2-23 TaxID=3415006 RepID=UPI003C7035DD